jgi:hypothetical protein
MPSRIPHQALIIPLEITSLFPLCLQADSDSDSEGGFSGDDLGGPAGWEHEFEEELDELGAEVSALSQPSSM